MSAVRTLRESKNLSQVAVAIAADISESKYQRIELGGGKTTDEEIAAVTKVITKMKASDRKIGGRPFADPAKQAEALAARGVTEDLIGKAPTKKAVAKKAPAKKASPTRRIGFSA